MSSIIEFIEYIKDNLALIKDNCLFFIIYSLHLIGICILVFLILKKRLTNIIEEQKATIQVQEERIKLLEEQFKEISGEGWLVPPKNNLSSTTTKAISKKFSKKHKR